MFSLLAIPYPPSRIHKPASDPSMSNFPLNDLESLIHQPIPNCAKNIDASIHFIRVMRS